MRRHAELRFFIELQINIPGINHKNGRNATMRLQAGNPANPSRHHPIPSSAKLGVAGVDGGHFVANISLSLTVADPHAGVRVAGSLHKRNAQSKQTHLSRTPTADWSAPHPPCPNRATADVAGRSECSRRRRWPAHQRGAARPQPTTDQRCAASKRATEHAN